MGVFPFFEVMNMIIVTVELISQLGSNEICEEWADPPLTTIHSQNTILCACM